jgi:branched-subunit amino acid transport protein
VSAAWATVLLLGLGTVALKGLGPVLLGGRALPARLEAVLVLLPPAVLAALVVTQTVADGEQLAVDARVAGVAAAAVAIAARAPILLVVVVAAAVTAGCRALGWDA